MQSKITGGETELLFTAKVLSKYNVDYYRCLDTGFIQTEEPYWLEEAYSSAITKLDVGLVLRNQDMANVTEQLLYFHFDHSKRFLDYAGGYGLFTRMMRDRGYDFYNTDIYCKNIFAEYQDLSQLPDDTGFELVTAFEVLEHLPLPLDTLKGMFDKYDNVLFSTELVPKDLKDLKDWWYFIFETGQHVSMYTKDALEFIAKKYNRQLYSNGTNIHLFSKKVFTGNPLLKQPRSGNFIMKKIRAKVERYKRRNNLNRMPQKLSLMAYDMEEARKRLL